MQQTDWIGHVRSVALQLDETSPCQWTLSAQGGGGGGGGGGGSVQDADATSGLAVVGVVCPPQAASGAGAAGEHAVLHDGVTSSSFGARGLGRCE